jgi:thioredoxin-like negative regulator of GroEL
MRLPILVMLSIIGSALCAAPVEVDPRELSGYVYSRANFFVMVYAPWCAHCVQSKPHFENIDSHVPTLLVDGSTTEGAVMRERYSIRGFPTFILFENAQPAEMYTGPRTTEAFEQFLNEKVPKTKEMGEGDSDATPAASNATDTDAEDEATPTHDEL